MKYEANTLDAIQVDEIRTTVYMTGDTHCSRE